MTTRAVRLKLFKRRRALEPATLTLARETEPEEDRCVAPQPPERSGDKRRGDELEMGDGTQAAPIPGRFSPASLGLLGAALKHLAQPGLQFCEAFFFGERRDPVSLGTDPALRPKHPCVFSNEIERSNPRGGTDLRVLR